MLSNDGGNGKLATTWRQFYRQSDVPEPRRLLHIWPTTALLLLDRYTSESDLIKRYTRRIYNFTRQEIYSPSNTDITRRNSWSSNPRRIAVPNPNTITLTLTLTFDLSTPKLLGYPKLIPYTKFENLGSFVFWVMLRTNKQTDGLENPTHADQHSRCG